MNRAAFLAIAFLVTGCCGCPKLPHGGKAASPEQFGQIFRHAVRNDCWSASYDLLSPRTRSEIPGGYAGWRIKAPSAEIPGTELLIVDFINSGESLAFVPNVEAGSDPTTFGEGKIAVPKPREYFWLFQAKFKEKGVQRLRLFKFLIVREEAGKDVWRLGFQDQIDRNLSFSAE